MGFTLYIKPELLILVPVLWALGGIIKDSSLPDWKIPFILGVTGIGLSVLWTVSSGDTLNIWAVLGEIAAGAAQGLLMAAAAVYWHQIAKQLKVGRACEKDKKVPGRHNNTGYEDNKD